MVKIRYVFLTQGYFKLAPNIFAVVVSLNYWQAIVMPPMGTILGIRHNISLGMGSMTAYKYQT